MVQSNHKTITIAVQFNTDNLVLAIGQTIEGIAANAFATGDLAYRGHDGLFYNLSKPDNVVSNSGATYIPPIAGMVIRPPWKDM